jgi:pyrimidine dimer DNA glycosylase
MRLWTVHPKYLDSKGLVAAWRESLLAQSVLARKTRGYRHHPQLARFRAHKNPLAAIATFLDGIAKESRRRGYHFDTAKIARPKLRSQLDESRGQLLYEWKHFLAKIRTRAPKLYRKLKSTTMPDAHPLFRIVPGKIKNWEKRKRSG